MTAKKFFEKMQNAWLWFVALSFLFLGVAALLIWIGSIVMFISSKIGG